MKKIARSLVALGLLTALPGFAATPAPVPAAIANHEGPIRIAVIRNLGSDDNTTQFVAGAIQEGKKLGFKVSTFLSNGDDAKFQDFVNQAISQKYDGIILSQGRDPYSTALVTKAVRMSGPPKAIIVGRCTGSSTVWISSPVLDRRTTRQPSHSADQ